MDERLTLVEDAWASAKKYLKRPSTLSSTQKKLNSMGATLLKARAKKMRAQFTSLDRRQNEATLKSLFEQIATQAGSFEGFKFYVEQELAGIVFTAHPTFALSAEAQAALEDLLVGGKPDLTAISAYHPTQSPSLEDEMREANRAIENTRAAISDAMRIAIDVAYEQYPDQWHNFIPRFITVASWVGFDLDGRTDIGWSRSQAFRYHMALQGLAEITKQIKALKGLKGENAAQLDTIKSGISVFQESFELGRELLEETDPSKECFARLNRAAMERRPQKEASIEAIETALNSLMVSGLGIKARKKIALLRAEWHAFGLCLSHIHFRLNAVQLHNAIRPEIGLKRSPDHSASRRHYLSAITRLLNKVKPVSIHYGNLARENTTARRVFMLAAQFQKHFDRRTPIRMLVAESDTPFTMLTALYYAKLFDVDDHVEISPLFETDIGLRRGDRVIRELIDNKHFLAYIKKQGRFCVQLGFSDSGRYIGQMAANLAIERFKLRLIAMWRDVGLDDIQLLFFDTHGESIGRGAHPQSLNDRFLYTQSKEVRRHLTEMRAPHKHEVSFQGGDGYLWFADKDMAFAVVTDFLKTRLSFYDPSIKDPFYENTGWSLDFFLTLREHQEKLADKPGYVAMIDSIGQNLLFPTGSRAVKRQSKGKVVQALDNISQLRAIPHNAVLQQLGYMANSLHGLGGAIRLAPEKFISVYAKSERLQRLSAIAFEASRYSDPLVMKSYQRVVSPDGWLYLAERESDLTLRSRMRRMSASLERMFKHNDMADLMRDIRRDAGRAVDAADEGQHGLSSPSKTLYKLHKMRLALIQFIYLKAMEVPRFSSRLDISLEELLDGIYHFDIPETLKALAEIFPTDFETQSDEDFGEDTTFAPRQEGYDLEHETIFRPISEAYELLLAISGLIAIEIGAFG